MSIGSGSQQKGDPVALFVREMDFQVASLEFARLYLILRASHEREFGDEFAASAEVPRRRDAGQSKPRSCQIPLGRHEQLRSPMNMACARGAPGDIKTGQHLPLGARSEALSTAQSVGLNGGFKLFQGRDAKFTIQLQDFLRTNTRNGQHFEDAGRKIAAQFLKAWMRASEVQLLNNIGDRLTDARDFPELAFGNQHVERNGQGGEIVGRL